MPRLKLTALGSSFAAGPSIDPIINEAAKRSGRNYAHQLAHLLGADVTDLTVSGATLVNVLDTPQETLLPRHVFPPQLDGLPSDTDIVTLTGGGNDMGYSFGMLHDSMASHGQEMVDLLNSWVAHPAAPVQGQALVDRFVAVLDKIHSIAPQAKVYLVQYLSIFGSASKPGTAEIPLTEKQIAQYKQTAKDLDQVYEKAAAARAEFTELVPAAKLSEGHEVGTAEPWMLGFDLDALWKGVIPYHPNLAGHTAVAAELAKRIKAVGNTGSG
ncbi:hypothetical protein LTR08_006849 [Meristemomyces frigidus]|nr:hypothetical protein LTR08_006849 [Meristemomyces frigidus]